MTPSPNIGLYRPDHGDWPDTWEVPVNYNWDVIDALFDGTRSDSGGTGHIHDGTDGQGPQIDHDDLLNKGTIPHSQLDSDRGKVLVSVADTVIDYLQEKIKAGANVSISLVNPGGDEELHIAVPSVPSSMGDPGDPSGEYGWKHFVPTCAPVVYTDNFTYPVNFRLKNAGYASDQSSAPGGVGFYPFTTGYSAIFMADPVRGDDRIGRYNSTVKCHVPHNPAQRATISLTQIDRDAMHEGDYVAFSLAVYATHQLGPNLPQKYGIVLELHLVKLLDAPETWQFTHRIVVIPDDVTQVQLFECHHSDPEDMLGCWELSIDQNGHLYSYYRRHLVFSTQSSPPSSSGPLLAYYPTLTTSLQAISDPPFGAIGFGCQYDIGFDSNFQLEARWFSAAGTDDLFYETPSCGPFPVDLPDLEEVPPYFWDDPGPNPNPVPPPCCPGGTKAIGESCPAPPGVLRYVTACCIYTCPSCGDRQPGYMTNTTGGECLPCTLHWWPPTEPPWDPTSGTNPPGPITEGDTDGKFVEELHLAPANVAVDSLNSYFHVDWVNYIDPTTFYLRYHVDNGSAGLGGPVDIEFYNPDDPATKITLRLADAISEAPTSITGATFTDAWTSLVDGTPLSFTTYNVRLTSNGGFNPTTTFVVDPGTLVSSTYVDPDTFDLVITLGSETGNASITASDIAAGTDVYDYTIAPRTPVFTEGTIDGTAGTGKKAILKIPYLDGGSGFTITPAPPGALLNITAVVHDPVLRTLSFTYDVEASLTPGTPVYVTITDIATGLSAYLCLLIVDGGPVPTISSVTPNREAYVGRSVTYTINGTNFGDDVTAKVTGLTVGPNGLPGASRILSATSTQIVLEVTRIEPVGITMDLIVSAPEAAITPARLVTHPAIDLTEPVPTLSQTGSSYSAGLEPGVSGTATIDGTGFTLDTEIEVISDSELLTFDPATLTIIGPTQLTIDYEVADRANGETVDLRVRQRLDGSEAAWIETLGNQSPVVDSVTPVDGGYFSPLRTLSVLIEGKYFDAGAAVLGSGTVSVTGYSWVSATEMTADLLCGGSAGAFTLTVQNPDGNTDDYNSSLDPEQAADVFHAEGDLVEGATGVTVYIYGEFLDPPGLSLVFTNASFVSLTTGLRTYIEAVVDITGVAGNDVTVTINSTLGSYGPFTIGTIVTGTPSPVITSVSDPNPKEYTNYPAFTIYGIDLTLVNSVIFEINASEVEKAALKYLPKGATEPIVVNSIVSKTSTEIVLDIDIGDTLVWRKFDISLRDAGMVEIGRKNNVLWVEAYDTNVPYMDETVVDPQIVRVPNATYGMTVPILSGTPWLPTDVWTAVNAAINSQVWNGVDAWLLNIKNGSTPLSDVELTLSRPALGIPPYSSVYAYALL